MTVIKGLFLQKDFGTKAAVEYGQKKKKESKPFGDDRICIVLITFTCILSVKTVQLKDKQKGYQSRIEVLQGQIGKEEDYAAQLEEKRIYVQTKQYVEEMAREKLGLVNADELLIKANDD